MRLRTNFMATSIAALLAVAIAAPAGAAEPLFHESWNDQFSERETGAEEACGIDHVVAHISMKGHATGFEDGTTRAQDSFRAVVENQANGAYAVLSSSNSVTLQGTETLDGDILTIQGSDTFRGNEYKWSAPGMGVIVRDAGYISFQYEIVVDTTTGEVLSFSDSIFQQGGLFPWADQGFDFTPEQAEAVCAALRG